MVSRTLDGQLAQLDDEAAGVQAEQAAAQQQFESLARRREDAQRQLEDLEARLAELEAAAKQGECRIDEGEQQLRECQRWATATRVERAKSEQRLDGMRLQLRQFEADQQERSRALADAQQQLTSAADRRRVAVQSVLAGHLRTGRCCTCTKTPWRREIANAPSAISELVSQRAHLGRTVESQAARTGTACATSCTRANWRRATCGMNARRWRIDCARTMAWTSPNSWTKRTTSSCSSARRSSRKLPALKRKISNIGAVNMEALHELDDLEARHESLHSQFQDLTQAKESLERIIHKINADSRRLFSETLEAIRTNFQQLYRKAFGGGKADIVLEEGVDILECGVDIVATPPGKPSFSNSLLSGGEKALTAVALLLAIFQYRPSPFCVLDEVDAPFDEANIGRFVDVLKDFLGWTKFVLVTHSKKTMTAATTLYGVTMQESGVSKQVSVRFEDVSEDGRISAEAVRRADQAQAAEDEQAA